MHFPGPPKRWNDWLALLVLVGVPVLWVYGHLSDTVTGATITGWTLVIQHYWRKTQPADPAPSMP